MATIWMFSGQGSQYFGMGRELYEADREFRHQLDLCADLAWLRLGCSLVDLIFAAGRDGATPMARLGHSHPALFAVQYSLARCLLARGLEPDAVLGYSLGEIVALAVAGSLSLDEALDGVLRQAALIEHGCPRGGMLAVLDSPGRVQREPDLFQGAHVAGENFDRHFVLAGAADVLDRIERDLTLRFVNVQRLPIAYPFHSPLIEPMEPAFRRCTADLQPTRGVYPVLSTCWGGSPIGAGADYWWEVMRRPVLFSRTVAQLESRGPNTYVDLGPSGTLAGFVRHNSARAASSQAVAIMTPFGGESARLAALQGKRELALSDC